MLESRLDSESWFQITEEQEEEVAVKVERVRQRMQYSELMGRAPQISVGFSDTLYLTLYLRSGLDIFLFSGTIAPSLVSCLHSAIFQKEAP